MSVINGIAIEQVEDEAVLERLVSETLEECD